MTPPTSTPTATAPTEAAESRMLHVVDLTDEELLGIDGPHSEQVAPLPWLGGRSAEDTVLAAEVGLRSLVTHGRATTGEEGLDLPAELAPVLDLRHDAHSIVYADHSTPLTQETRVLYLHPEVVLAEHVNAAGVHRFLVGDLDAALTDLAAWCEPQCHEGDQGHLEGDDLPAELAGLQAVVCLDVVTLVGEDVQTRTLTLYRLADGSVVEGIETPGRLELLPRNGRKLRGRVVATVTGAGAPVAG